MILAGSVASSALYLLTSVGGEFLVAVGAGAAKIGVRRERHGRRERAVVEENIIVANRVLGGLQLRDLIVAPRLSFVGFKLR